MIAILASNGPWVIEFVGRGWSAACSVGSFLIVSRDRMGRRVRVEAEVCGSTNDQRLLDMHAPTEFPTEPNLAESFVVTIGGQSN